jgi:thymidylate synthase ThyX
MALMARYSRSTHPSMIDALDREFSKETYTPEMLERVINEYGDASVLELSNVQMAIEGISNIALNDIEKSRIGISFLEKSSRYVDYTKDFRYYTPDVIKYNESLFKEYTHLMELSRDYYSNAITTLTDHVFNQYPIESLSFYDSEQKKETRYDNLSLSADRETARKIHRKSIKEYVLDNVRSFLPSSLITNVAFNTNFRSLRELLARLHASKIQESNRTYYNLMDMLEPYQLLLKRITNLSLYRQKNNELFDIYNSRNSVITIYKNYIQEYIDEYEEAEAVPIYNDRPKVYTKPDTRMVWMYDKETSEALISASIISEYDDITTKNINFADMVNYFLDEDNCTIAQKEYLVQNYTKNRESKFDKAGIAFEFLDFIFEIHSSFGTFRDLRRHRTLTRVYDKVITTKRGYLTPREFHFSDRVVKNYVDIQNKYSALYDKILEKTDSNYYVAQYCTNFGNIIKYIFKANLRELTTLCELRTGLNAHFEYRQIAYDMFNLMLKNNSELLIKNAMRFINQDPNTKLGRLEENKKISNQNIPT